jgi:DNA polymerase-4
MLDLVGQVGWRLRHQKLTGTTVTLKIKYADFKTITRSISATAPIRWDEEIAVLATKLLQKIDLRKPVRLLGVSLSNLEALDTRPTLGFAEDEKMGKRNLAIDALKDKFGEQIIQRGLTQDNTKNVPEGQKK